MFISTSAVVFITISSAWKLSFLEAIVLSSVRVCLFSRLFFGGLGFGLEGAGLGLGLGLGTLVLTTRLIYFQRYSHVIAWCCSMCLWFSGR